MTTLPLGYVIKWFLVASVVNCPNPFMSLNPASAYDNLLPHGIVEIAAPNAAVLNIPAAPTTSLAMPSQEICEAIKDLNPDTTRCEGKLVEEEQQ